jgi:T5SS/PEP-CTERM-associated repeat protein
MKKTLLSRKALLVAFSILSLSFSNDAFAQDPNYNWTGAADGNFYNTANWTSTVGPVVFDNSAFKFVRTHSVSGNAPIINQTMDWQPGVFDNTGGDLVVNADFFVFFNDKLNGTVTVNTGASFVCRNIFRIGREGSGTLNVNGGTFMSNNTDTWQGVFIGVLSGGNGVANVSNGGLLSGGYQLEIGTRNFYPTGLLNVKTDGTADAYWATVIGPNGTVNIDGGILNAGEKLIVGDLYVDNAGTEGATGEIVGKLNINSGTVTVNQNDLAAPELRLNAKAKVVIDNGKLILKRTGQDFTAVINDYVTAGQIVSATGKYIAVEYDGVLTTVTAKTNLGTDDFEVTENKFTVYPNPVKDVINIMAKKDFDGNFKIEIVTLAGAAVLEKSADFSSGSYAFEIKNKLASGLYLLKISNNDGVYTTKIVVE